MDPQVGSRQMRLSGRQDWKMQSLLAVAAGRRSEESDGGWRFSNVNEWAAGSCWEGKAG